MTEVINFQRSSAALKQQIISEHEALIEKEQTTLLEDIAALDNSIVAQKIVVEGRLLAEIEQLKQRLMDPPARFDLNFIQRFRNYIKHRFFPAVGMVNYRGLGFDEP
ncbi:MAG: hypothetical protein EOO13_10625 [Chitinophagaceae bacterium]|nr:MAG: hypothetical protein EOO13_10625 [Chitinophagaceae bacterium]